MIDWNNYYTPNAVAKELISKIPGDFVPSNVVDICGGSGNLLRAAFNEWNKARYIYADIHTPSVKKDDKLNNWDSYQINALCPLELGKLQFNDGIRLVLANPPFGHSKGTFNETDTLDNIVDLRSVSKKLNRIEAEMIVSNISLLRKGDIFAALLPENIFSSERFEKFKKLLLSNFRMVYEGPPNKYFKGSEVRTRLFVGIFTTDKSKPEIRSKNNDSNFDRLIYRGINNTKLFTETKSIDKCHVLQVLHFNNPSCMNAKKFMVDKRIINNYKTIKTGDLLVIRVGRHAGKVIRSSRAEVGKGVSDYLFMVKSGYVYSDKEIKRIEEVLHLKRKGLTTNYISKADVKCALNSISG